MLIDEDVTSIQKRKPTISKNLVGSLTQREIVSSFDNLSQPTHADPLPQTLYRIPRELRIPVLVDVAVAGRRVTWQFGTERAYHFELHQYLECFERASLNTTWESVGRTAERLVSSIDFTKLSDQGYRFEWASTRITRARVTLSFSKDGKQRLFGVEWDDRRAEDAEQQVRSWAAHYAEPGI